MITALLIPLLLLSRGVSADGPAYPIDGLTFTEQDGSRVTTGHDAEAEHIMVVSARYEASLAGKEILEKGGNIFDAAVAVGFAVSACEPYASGLGGGGMCTIHLADGRNVCVDLREIAPAGAQRSLFVGENGKSNRMNVRGGLSCAVPGEVAGLLYIFDTFGSGKLTLGEVMEPAIRIAEQGYTMTGYAAASFADAYGVLTQYEELGKLFLDEYGLPYTEGALVKNPDLGKALRKIVAEGRDGFYKGEIAEAVVSSVQKYGGVMTLEDLENYEAAVREPVNGVYRGYQIISAPPSSSGGTGLIEILNILEGYDIGRMKINSADYVHLLAETFKIAFADREAFMADDAFFDVPVKGLTSKEYAAARRKGIHMDKAADRKSGKPEQYESPSTTHFSLADRDGNCIAVTQTLDYYFGSGVCADGWGFPLNDQLENMTVKKTSRNVIAPGKRPLSSMTPAVVLNADGTPFLVLGTPGGARIFSSLAQIILRVVDAGVSLHDAVCIPKVWNLSPKDGIVAEMPLKGYEQYAVTEKTDAKLQKKGHVPVTFANNGSVQAIQFQADGTLLGVSDPRRDGKAAGF